MTDTAERPDQARNSEPYELVVLGTSSRIPTRQRNANGYLLRLGGMGLLFDPAEGTHRQLILCNVPMKDVTHVLITHLHADHCLGLAGVVDRLAQEGTRTPLTVLYPSGEEARLRGLLRSWRMSADIDIVFQPVAAQADPVRAGAWTVHAAALDHTVETVGYRICGPDPDAGAVFAFVMDSRPCQAAVQLASGADLLVCESTFLASQERMARDEYHMTAPQSAEIARSAKARSLLLTHFSPRHEEVNAFLHEARPVFSQCDVARDLTRVAVPRRAPAQLAHS